MQSVLIRRYANAVLVAKGGAQDFAAGLAMLRQTITDVPAFAALLRNRALSAAAKKVALEAVAAKIGLPALLTRLLLVLAENKRLNLLPAILETIERKIAEKEKGTAVTVVSAAPLTPALQQEVEAKLKTLAPNSTNIEYRAQPNLLGGYQIRLGNLLHDYSLAGTLARLRRHLLAS